MSKAIRYHDFSMGHRVHGHENKCALPHGHNYRIWFHCEGPLDDIGRVIDFGVMKPLLCEWLEDNWDHKFILWEKDPWVAKFEEMNIPGVVAVPFNPTAENIGQYLLDVVGPERLKDSHGVTLVKVVVEETRKCSAEVELVDIRSRPYDLPHAG